MEANSIKEYKWDARLPELRQLASLVEIIRHGSFTSGRQRPASTNRHGLHLPNWKHGWANLYWWWPRPQPDRCWRTLRRGRRCFTCQAMLAELDDQTPRFVSTTPGLRFGADALFTQVIVGNICTRYPEVRVQLEEEWQQAH